MPKHPRGVQHFEAKDQKWTMQFTINTLCEMEDEFDGKDIQEIANAMGTSPSVRMIRKMFRLALSEHHPEVTEKLAGELIGEIGITLAGPMLVAAMTSAFGTADDEKGKGDSPLPKGKEVEPIG